MFNAISVSLLPACAKHSTYTHADMFIQCKTRRMHTAQSRINYVEYQLLIATDSPPYQHLIIAKQPIRTWKNRRVLEDDCRQAAILINSPIKITFAWSIN